MPQWLPMILMGKRQFPGEVLPAAPMLQAPRACDDVGLEHRSLEVMLQVIRSSS